MNQDGKAAVSSTVGRLVGPDSDSFWDRRLAWLTKYRADTGSTTVEAIRAWESLANVGIHDHRPNGKVDAPSGATAERR